MFNLWQTNASYFPIILTVKTGTVWIVRGRSWCIADHDCKIIRTSSYWFVPPSFIVWTRRIIDQVVRNNDFIAHKAYIFMKGYVEQFSEVQKIFHITGSILKPWLDACGVKSVFWGTGKNPIILYLQNFLRTNCLYNNKTSHINWIFIINVTPKVHNNLLL